MKVRYLLEDAVDIRHGKVYEVVRIVKRCGRDLYSIVDESGERYLYDPRYFEIVEK